MFVASKASKNTQRTYVYERSPFLECILKTCFQPFLGATNIDVLGCGVRKSGCDFCKPWNDSMRTGALSVVPPAQSDVWWASSVHSHLKHGGGQRAPSVGLASEEDSFLISPPGRKKRGFIRNADVPATRDRNSTCVLITSLNGLLSEWALIRLCTWLSMIG